METAVQVFKIEEAGPDYVVLRDGDKGVRVKFADDETFTKEDSAAFFRPLQGKPAAIPVRGPFFIAVDFWRDDFGVKVVPFPFTISSVESA